MTCPVMLAQEEIQAYKEFCKSKRLKWKNFIPFYGLFNYVGIVGKKTKVPTSVEEQKPSVLEEIAHLGLARWPRNEEVRVDNIRMVSRNFVMALYHSAATVAVAKGLYELVNLTSEMINKGLSVF